MSSIYPRRCVVHLSLMRNFIRCIPAITLALFFSALFLCGHASGQDDNPVPTQFELRYDAHPRLLFHDSEIADIKNRIATDSFAKDEFESARKNAEALLAVPPCPYDLHKVEPTLLWTSREIESRILTLAGVYRLTGDRRFADRAIQEMLSASRFPDWNPSHFLDTAEMTAALGIGYDWLYPVMPDSSKRIIKDAIIRLGIQPFIDRLDSNRIHYHNNWIQVLYGGETVGALAIAESTDRKSMERAEKVVSYARPAISTIMKLFSPDGGFEEGPAYWSYATIYNVLYIDALQSAIGTDFGASDAPGFSLTPVHRIQSLGPTLQFANFGDSHPDTAPAPQMYWFARRFHRADYSREEQPISELMRSAQSSDALKAERRFQFLGLLWYSSGPSDATSQPQDKVKYFSRIGYIYMRTAWNDKNAWYVAFKGGPADLSHSHLDLGSFVLDGLGERWAIDMGPDSYELPEYFGPLRWNYYRLQSVSHNTLTVNGRSESPQSKATMLRYGRLGQAAFAEMNLTETYQPILASWKRSILLKDAGGVVLQDDYSSKQDAQIAWHFHTRALISISAAGRTATMVQNGKVLYATILAPSDARFTTEPCVGGRGEAENPGVTDLTILQLHAVGEGKIAVSFDPVKPEPLDSSLNLHERKSSNSIHVSAPVQIGTEKGASKE